MNPDTKFIVNNNINDLIQSQVGRLTQAFYSGSPFPIMAIFFTKENLQLSLPLLAITGTYGKYINIIIYIISYYLNPNRVQKRSSTGSID